MIQFLKSKAKKVISVITGRHAHLEVGIKISKHWYGNRYGGFFVCPELLNENSVVYSFGIGEDISFDEALIKNHGCHIFGFDPTPKSIRWIRSQKKLPPQFKFFEYGIGAKSGNANFFLPKNSEHVSGSITTQSSNVNEKKFITVQLKSLAEIAADLGHLKIDILKMDIEGGEFSLIENLLESGVSIKQICIEFHDRFFEDGQELVIQSINSLRKHGFEIFGVSDSFEEVSLINVRI